MTPLPDGGLPALWQENGYFLALALALFAAGLGQSGLSSGPKWAYLLFGIAIGTTAAWWGGTWAWGVLAFIFWLLRPVIEMLLSMGRLRVNRRRHLVDVLTYASEFEDLKAESSDWESLGFEVLDDREVKPAEPRQVFRFLISKDHRYFVAIGWIAQGPWTLTYSAVSCWDASGKQWMSWNYPLPYGLQIAPELRLWRCPSAESPDELLRQQIEFLQINNVEAIPRADLSEDNVASKMWHRWLSRQMEYNLSVGWLQLVGNGKQVAYSWRGMLGAGKQVLTLLFR